MTSKRDRSEKALKALENAIEKSKDENGNFSEADVSLALVKAARRDIELVDLYTWARGLVKSYVEARHPQIDQANFFDPEAIIALGKGRRVTLKDATRKDLLAWRKILVKQNNDQNQAFARQIEWLSANLEALESETQTLGQLRGLGKEIVP